MKKKRNRIFMLIPLLSLGLAGCHEPKNETLKGYFEGPDAPGGAITTIDDCASLLTDGYYLSFEKKEKDKYGVYFYDRESKELVAYNEAPAKIITRGVESFGMYETYDFVSGYDSVVATNYGYHCISIVLTRAKSEFRVMDSYYISKEHGFALNRKVTVIKARGRDAGYESSYMLKNGSNLQSVDDFGFFIPGHLYKDTKYNAPTALITSLYNPQVYVKETRLGLPMTMIYNYTNEHYLSIVHAEPDINVHGEKGGGADGAIDDDLEYGSLGFESEDKGYPIDIGITMCYPCAEGPATFDSGAGWARRFHQVEERHFHEYKMGLVFGKTESFNDALVDSYEKCYMYVDSRCKRVENELVYQQNIDCFAAETISINKNGVLAYGMPWELNVDKTKSKGPYSFQMGFVGQQTSVGAHLFRQGLDQENDDYKTKGEGILNFWTSDTIYPAANLFPYIWWNGVGGELHRMGTSTYATIYLRMLCDGVEGILDAYLYGKEYNVTKNEWLDYCVRFADALISVQNEDGSFNRAFTKDGGIPGDEFGDKNIGFDGSDPAKFKINTPIAIRFLCKMYDTVNGDSPENIARKEAYKEAARRAADYSYNNIYLEMGKYVGGTCDNANVVDKEAAIYAMFGFRYAYALFGDERYEKAMRHAACTSLSWTFMYDYACPANDEDLGSCPYVDGHVMGTSIIATGHAGVDGFACYMWYDIFKVYQLTGCEMYKKAAITLQNAVKLFTDYDGSKDWTYPCLMVEACQVMDFLFKPTNKDGSLWLPWCGVAQINPIMYTYLDFGVYQLEDVVL
ncbi:MAG: hypothetical protein ACOX3C_01630 [Bacilli bacterium]